MSPATKKTSSETPLMRQYGRIKARHPDDILLFRMGDFYEMFGRDAVKAAPVLGIALTKRANGKAADIALAGFPHHASVGYIKKLVDHGLRVAVCDQVEDPKLAKGIVKREVTEVITPGTLVSDELLGGAQNNFLVAVALPPEGRSRKIAGLARIDLSTGEFHAGELPLDELEEELGRDGPGEILGDRDRIDEIRRHVPPELRAVPLSGRDGWELESGRGGDLLREHFGTATLAGFGLEDRPLAIAAAGAALGYVRESRRSALPHISELRLLHRGGTMLLDAQTRRNLELTARGEEGSREGTLLSIIDRTATAAGARRLRSWLLEPLTEPARIHARQLAVQLFFDGQGAGASELLSGTADLERIAARIGLRRASPRDLAALRETLRIVPALRSELSPMDSPLLRDALDEIPDLGEIGDLLERALSSEPPARATDPGVIASGFSEELDRLRGSERDGKRWVAELAERECAETGIASLKVKFNRVFGYFIEVTRPNLHLVPERYVRKQTMATAERFITPELKELEERLLHAEERAAALEARLFDELIEGCARSITAVQKLAAAISLADLLSAFARVARERGYIRPLVDTEERIEIEEGRHPVLDAAEMEESFVPNGTDLCDSRRLLLVTGPNMAGKSTYLRQVGLIVLLAQVGSFVPAQAARIGVVDRIFTRVGTSDDLLRGRSTFLVEMVETASILHNAGPRSLVLLDEIGRGTSTYDGLALAWAITEHLHDLRGGCPLTLFATHYHELTELAASLEKADNLTTKVREKGEEVVFLRRIEPGVADRSYGIHVARMAGIPREVLRRARQVLAGLEAPRRGPAGRLDANQMDLFSAPAPPLEPEPDPLIDEIRAIDADELTPRQALDLLYRWSEEAKC